MIRASLAAPSTAPHGLPPSLSKLTGVERRVHAILAAAGGAFVACSDLVLQIYGPGGAARKTNIQRYLGNVRLALRVEGRHAIVSAGAGPELRYALVPAQRAAPAEGEAGRRQREVLGAVVPDGDHTRKGQIVRTLVSAGGQFLLVTDLARQAFGRVDPGAMASIRSLVNEVRSTLRTKGIAASILTTGIGEALAYAWSDGIAAPPEPDADAPKAGLRITLPPLGGRPCFFDGDSLVVDGVKRERVSRR